MFTFAVWSPFTPHNAHNIPPDKASVAGFARLRRLTIRPVQMERPSEP